MALTPEGRRMIDEGIENLGSALRMLSELIADGMTDAEISNRIEAYALAVAIFTRRSSWHANGWHTQLLSPKGKFNKPWRELLEIASVVYQVMRRWHADGYDYVAFYSQNSQCYPCHEHDETRKEFTGGWTALDKMISVYCHGGVLMEPSPRAREVQSND